MLIISFVYIEMESLPLTAEAIAFTEKKMDMTLGMLYDNFFSRLITL